MGRISLDGGLSFINDFQIDKNISEIYDSWDAIENELLRLNKDLYLLNFNHFNGNILDTLDGFLSMYEHDIILNRPDAIIAAETVTFLDPKDDEIKIINVKDISEIRANESRIRIELKDGSIYDPRSIELDLLELRGGVIVL